MQYSLKTRIWIELIASLLSYLSVFSRSRWGLVKTLPSGLWQDAGLYCPFHDFLCGSEALVRFRTEQVSCDDRPIADMRERGNYSPKVFDNGKIE